GPLANRLTAVLQIQEPANNQRPGVLTRPDPEMVAKFSSSLADRVPSYMIPAVWLGIDKLPASTSNKLDRKTLLAKVEALSRNELSLLSGSADSDTTDSVKLDAQ